MNVPARLAEGERLYRDVVYHYGPAGPWLEAAALFLFGRRFAVLHALGALAAVLIFAALWRLTARAGSRLSACLAVTWAAALCVGAPNGGSFLYPYSFDALFALAGAWLCLEAASGPDRGLGTTFSAAGLALALAAKPEVGAAAAVVLFLAWLRAADGIREARRTLTILSFGAGVAALLWTAALAGVPVRGLSPEGPFALFQPPAEWRAVYRVISGFADPAASLESVATALFLAAVVLGIAVLLSRAGSAGLAVGAVAAAAAVAFFLTSGSGIDDRLPPLLSPIPVASVLAALFLLRRPLDPTARARFLLFGFAAAFASRVLLGLAYGAVTTPYSILAVPGLAASAAVLVLDVLTRRLTAPVAFRRLVAVAVLALSIMAVVRWRRLLPPAGAVRLETAAGSLRLRPERAIPTAQTLAFLAANAREGDGLSGMPEAGFFNFVTGHRNPLRHEQIYPGHLDSAGEARLAQQIDRAGPRFFLLVNQPAPAFGSVAFGRDYAVEVWRAVERRYRLVAAFGEPPPEVPVGDPRFFIRVYERLP